MSVQPRDAGAEATGGQLPDGPKGLPGLRREHALPARFRPTRVPLPHGLLKLASLAFFAQWLAATGAGLLIQHYAPGERHAAQFMALLGSSLATFVCAVIATIELLKFNVAGRSVALALAWANAAVYGLAYFYAQHGVFVLAQVVFALALCGLVARPAGARKRALALLGLSFLLMLAPSAYYAIQRTRAPALMTRAYAALARGAPAEAAESFDRARSAYGALDLLGGWLGERPDARAVWRANLGLAQAHAGDPAKGFQTVVAAFALATPDRVYEAKARTYCLMIGIPYVPRHEREVSPEDEFRRDLERLRRENPDSVYQDDLSNSRTTGLLGDDPAALAAQLEAEASAYLEGVVAKAREAEAEGDRAGAIADYQTVIARYPGSKAAKNAQAEIARLNTTAPPADNGASGDN